MSSILDAVLLDSLVAKKLEKTDAKVRKDGWKTVDADCGGWKTAICQAVQGQVQRHEEARAQFVSLFVS